MKSTPVGDIPVDWELSKFATIGTIGTGLVSPETSPYDNQYYLGPENIESNTGRIKNLKTCKKLKLISGKYPFTSESLVYSKIRPNLNKVCEPDFEGVCSADAYEIKPTDKCSKPYLAQAMRSYVFLKQAIACSMRTGMPKINQADLNFIKIPLPPLPEQRKIAEVLGTWDRAIETQQQLIDSLTRRKKALMQQLLTGKTRLPGFGDEWQQAKLSDLFSRVSKKNTDGHTQVVTISAQKGLICQQDYFKKQIASKILDNYFVLGKGQFAYNKSYSKGYPMGAIKRLNRYDHGVVTTLYICFELKSEDHSHSDFWEHYFESGALNRGLTRIAHEGGRAHGLLNVTPKDFFELKLQAPSFDEQQAIAKVHTAAIQEIQLHTTQLTSLRTQKRGLMQQLLTGKTRVSI